MPKSIASADLASIYGDPDRAAAEAEAELAAAREKEKGLFAAQAGGRIFLGGLLTRANRDEQNARFKLGRAKAAAQIRDVSTSPILLGLSANQLKVLIVVGVVVALWLFFF